jgi:hypothetical protein
MVIDEEKSIRSPRGLVRHFSRRAFARLAGDLERCFMCGVAKSAAVVFNDEHVVPDWVLRRFHLQSRRITIFGGHQIMYSKYKLRCCQGCNTLLGKKIEEPISALFVDDANMSQRNLFANRTLLYQWLCLLFIKMHLKDREYRIHRDLRKDTGTIGKLYDWEGLHHIHSVARSAQSRGYVRREVLGTIIAFKMKPSNDPFDIGTISGDSTIVLRIGSLGIVAVLNDCCGVTGLIRAYLSRISGPLSAIQLREVAARAAYGNHLLKSRPIFWSEFKAQKRLTLHSAVPERMQVGRVNRKSLGRRLAFACGPLLLRSHTPDKYAMFERLQRAEVQFLYHDDGTFIAD